MAKDTVMTLLSPSPYLTDAQDIAVFALPSELTVAQAAKILDTSEACLNQLLDIGAYEFRQDGDQRFIERDYLMERAQQRARRRMGLREMVQMNQEMGLYDD